MSENIQMSQFKKDPLISQDDNLSKWKKKPRNQKSKTKKPMLGFWSRFTSNPKLIHGWECGQFFVMKVILLTLDVGTDFSTAFDHFSSKNKFWGILTLIPIFLPVLARLIILIFGHFLPFSGIMKKKGSIWEVIWQLPVFQTIKNFRLFFALFLMDTSLPGNGILVNQIKTEAMDSGILEAFLESAPQFILQSYIILQKGYISNSQLVGMPLSFLSLTISSMMMFFVQRLGRYSDTSPPIKAKAFVFSFVVLQLMGPLFSLVLMALYFREFISVSILIIITINYLAIKFFVIKSDEEYETLYPNSERLKEKCHMDIQHIVSTAVFTSWISTTCVLTRNFLVKSHFLITTSVASTVSHVFSILIIFALVSLKTSINIKRYPLLHCFNATSLQNFLHDSEFCHQEIPYFWTYVNISRACHQTTEWKEVLRVCANNEEPTDLFYYYVAPVSVGLLLMSLISAMCLQALSDFECLWRWSSKATCNKVPVIHYTLVQDWIDESNDEDLYAIQAHLNGMIINHGDPIEGETALHHAARVTNKDLSSCILLLLLKQGGDTSAINIYGRTPIFSMSPHQKTVLINYQRKYNASSGYLFPKRRKKVWEQPPMSKNCSEGKIVSFMFLNLIGGSLQAQDEDGKRVYEGLLEWIDNIIVGQNRNSLLVKLITIMVWMLEFQDNGGRTAIHYAAGLGSVNCLRFMLEKAKDVDKENIDGSTGLHVAAKYGNLECLKVLIEEHGANFDKRQKEGLSSLHFAAWYAKTECLQYLLSKGAIVNCRNRNNDTPLHIAGIVSENDSESLKCCQELILANADINAKNLENNTPLETNWFVRLLMEQRPHLFTSISNTSPFNESIDENALVSDQ